MNKKLTAIISYLIILVLVPLAAYAIHDVLTAQGVGYFFYLKTGILSRGLFDMLLDGLVFVIFLVLTIVPLQLFGTCRLKNYATSVALFLALMPVFSGEFICRMFVDSSVYKPAVDSVSWFISLSSLLKLTVPSIVIIYGALYVTKRREISRSDVYMAVAAFFVLLCGLPLSGLLPLCEYVSSYLLFLVLVRAFLDTSDLLFVLEILLSVASIYRIISVCQSFSVIL